jgi:hypothetical protein
MMISMTAALDYDDKFKNQPPAEKLKRKLEAFVSTTAEDKKGRKKGFFMNFYVPFLAEMKEKDLLLTACYIMGTPAADEEGKKWLDANKNKVEDFYKWMDAYKWQKD